MIRLTFLIFILFFLSNCSFSEKSRIWNDKKEKIENQNLKKLFAKEEKKITEFNPDLKLDLSKLKFNNSTLDNQNNFGAQIYENLNKKTIKRMENIPAAKDGIADAELIEIMAKGYGVDTTKKLLYDITEQRRFWETSRWLFPFGNAYQEVLTTWIGIMKANPQVAARTGTIWDGASQENDTFGPTGKGIFYKNPINGQVVFNYPGTGLIQD